MTKISVLVPFGATDDMAGVHRRRVWAWCRRRWAQMLARAAQDSAPYPLHELVVGTDPLFGKRRTYHPADETSLTEHPFSVARALNDAARRATGNHFLLFGADHVPDPAAVIWATHQLRAYAFARIYDRVAYATEAATQIILSNTSFPLDAADWHMHPAPCPGVLGVRRSAFEKAGGLDERYEGWGYEDTAFLDTLAATHHNGLRGTMGPSGFILRELWHDPGKRDLDGRNAALYRKGRG